MRILCVMLALPADVNPDVVQCIASQTVPISLTLLLTEQVNAPTWAARICRILNNGLRHVNVGDFDYILRVDCDVWLPPDFVEGNLRDRPDVCGLGAAMLIKTSSFQQVMGGRFDPHSDDAAIHYEFQRHGLTAVSYTVNPQLRRLPGATHRLTYWVEQGHVYYQLGFEPFHVLAKLRLGWRHALSVVGYVHAILNREPRCRCAKYVRFHQLRRLIHPWSERATLRSARFPTSR